MVTLHLNPTLFYCFLLDCVFEMKIVLTPHAVPRYVHGGALVIVSRPALLDNTLSISTFFSEV